MKVGSDARAAVTNLLAVGSQEVVAIFSDGTMVLWRAGEAHPSSRYLGHVNLGTMEVVATADTISRLLAVRGSDGIVRIWHLDDPYPLNSDWHRLRSDPALGQELMPEELTQTQRLLMRSKQIGQSDATKSEDDRGLAAYRSLLTASNGTSDTQHTYLSECNCRQARGLAFVPMSWAADRDAQWEQDRRFDTQTGQARGLVGGGVLPGLCMADDSDSATGPRILYFESDV